MVTIDPTMSGFAADQHDKSQRNVEEKVRQEEEKEDVANNIVPDVAPAKVDDAITAPSTIMTTTSFADLGMCDVLCQACDRLQWPYATQIQAQVLPDAIEGRDVIGLAETGSGKTGAFLLPILHRLLHEPRNQYPRSTAALILAPTRELAVQILHVAQALGQAMQATCCGIVGGVERAAQAVALAKLPHLIVATPGRLLDHLKDTKGFHLRHVRYLVLDEADRMLGLDFEEELHQILNELPNERRQTMLFSATMTSQVQKLERASLKDPVRVAVNAKFTTPAQLAQHYLFIPARYKDCYLTYLINELAGHQILVFGATKDNVQRLALLLRNLGFAAVCLHGGMPQDKRLGALRKFAAHDRHVMICTDIASRGLDLPKVDVVINYDLPDHGKEYIHRVGRTARAGAAGQAIALVTQYDVEVYQRIEHLLGKKLPEYQLEESVVLVLLERVSEAARLAQRELKEQLASYRQDRTHGGRHRRRKHDDDDLEQVLQHELQRGYAGGSGGQGGALHNQRGALGKAGHKKQRRRK